MTDTKDNYEVDMASYIMAKALALAECTDKELEAFLLLGFGAVPHAEVANHESLMAQLCSHMEDLLEEELDSFDRLVAAYFDRKLEDGRGKVIKTSVNGEDELAAFLNKGKTDND